MGVTDEAELLEALLRTTTELRTIALATMVAGVSSLALGVAGWLLVGRPAAIGALPPLWLAGVIFLVGGAVRYQAAEAELARLPEVVREAPHRLEDRREWADLARSRESVLRLIDGGGVALGLLLLTRRGWMRGCGFGLVVASAAAFALDHHELDVHREQVELLAFTVP